MAVQCGGGLLAFALTSCATQRETVDHRMRLSAGEATHDTTSREFFVMPMTLDAPDPLFPADASGGDVAVTVCAEVWLSEDGDITRLVPDDASPGCDAAAAAVRGSYMQAVLSAMRQWRFSPAMICTFAPEAGDKRARGDCTGEGVSVRRVPVRLGDAFTFSRQGGKRQVGRIRHGATPDR